MFEVDYKRNNQAIIFLLINYAVNQPEGCAIPNNLKD